MEEPVPIPTHEEELRKLKIDSLFEEYRAMYGLVQFRMSSLDRRVPIAGATLTATLASVAAIPQQALMIVFLGLPMALVWFLRTTINHARSFEDVLRRIEQIEGDVNELLDHEAICFQSRHPSRGHRVGGRTGFETIGAVLVTVVTLLIGCAFMFLQTVDTVGQAQIAYAGFLAVVLAYMILIVVRLKRYEYKPQ